MAPQYHQITHTSIFSHLFVPSVNAFFTTDRHTQKFLFRGPEKRFYVDKKQSSRELSEEPKGLPKEHRNE
jgi:hypothetical protein